MLLERCRNDHLAWINGDGAPYALPDEGTIMGAVGGCSRGGLQTLERQIAVAKQWVSGEGSVEFVNGSVDGDVAWLVTIERASVMIRGKRRLDVGICERPKCSGEPLRGGSAFTVTQTHSLIDISLPVCSRSWRTPRRKIWLS